MAASESTDRVYLVCLIHLIICIIFIACLTPGNAPVTVGGVSIYPVMQAAFATFNCLQIIIIVAAGVGNLYLIQGHMGIYLYTLYVSLASDIVWIAVFCVFGTSCTTSYLTKATSSCEFTAGGVIVVLAFLIMFKVVALWLVSRARRAIRSKYSEELLPYLNKTLRNSISSWSAFGAEGYNGEYEATQPSEVVSRAFQAQSSLSFRGAPPGVSAVPGDGYGSTMESAAPGAAPATAAEPPPAGGCAMGSVLPPPRSFPPAPTTYMDSVNAPTLH